MRPYEILLAVLTLSASLIPLTRLRSPLLGWLFCLLAAVLLTLHLFLEGAHWQLAYLYLAVPLVALLLFRAPPRSALGLIPAILVLTLTPASLVLAWALPLFHLPAPTGPYAVGTRTLHLTDPTTHRELVTQLWYPAVATGPLARYARSAEVKPLFSYLPLIRTNAHQDAPVAPGSRYPLLLFNPSWNGRRNQDTFLLEDLASHGYLIASIDHPGNAARVQLADGQVVRSTMAQALDTQPTPQAVLNVWNTELAVWTRDTRFVLTALTTSSAFAPFLDTSRIGAFGHSFGGATSLALLGQDPRVRCAINMDGWTFAGLDHRTSQPVLMLYSAPPAAVNPHPETLPSDAYQSDQLERTDRMLVDANLARYGGSKGYVLGSQHADFTDETLLSPIQRLTYTGPIPPARMRQLTRSLVLNFFDHTLRDRPWNARLMDSPELYWTAKPR
jgi:predicted dienelactone hydrolase